MRRRAPLHVVTSFSSASTDIETVLRRWFFGGETTVPSSGSGLATYSGQAIEISRGLNLAVGAATAAYTAQAIDIVRGRTLAIGAAAASYVGQSILTAAGGVAVRFAGFIASVGRLMIRS